MDLSTLNDPLSWLLVSSLLFLLSIGLYYHFLKKSTIAKQEKRTLQKQPSFLLSSLIQDSVEVPQSKIGGGLSCLFSQQHLRRTFSEDLSEHVTQSFSQAEDRRGSIGDSIIEALENDDAGLPIEQSESLFAMKDQAEQTIRHSEFFSWLPDHLLKKIAKDCELIQIPAKAVLFRSGEVKTPCASTFLLCSGEFSLIVSKSFFTTVNENDDGETSEEDEYHEETIKVGPGKSITGVSDFIATIVGEPVTYAATGIANSNCVIAQISHNQLEIVFENFEGLREDLLLRSLTVLQRVTNTALYRLTGRYASSFLSRTKKIHQPALLTNKNTPLEGDWQACLMKTLNITEDDINLFLLEHSSQDDRQRFPLFINLNDKEPLSMDDPALYIVINGGVEVRTINFKGEESKGTLQYRAYCGDSIAHLAVLTKTFSQWYHLPNGEYPFNLVQAIKDNTKVLKIPENVYFEFVNRFPEIVHARARRTVSELAPIVRLIDAATEFKTFQSGQVVSKQGEVVDGLMVVLHGRVRYYEDSVGGLEFVRGAVVGESSFLSRQPSSHAILATKTTSLACISRILIRAVASLYPKSLAHMGRMISKRSYQQSHGTKSVAIVPLTSKHTFPFDEFVQVLQSTLTNQNYRSHLFVSSSFTPNACGEEDQLEILSEIQDEEETNDIVFFSIQDDSQKSKIYINQADLILFVIGNANLETVKLGEVGSQLMCFTTPARRELIILHSFMDVDFPSFVPNNTREWIEQFGCPLSMSHQIRFHPNNIDYDLLHFKSDIRKLCRWLTGNSVGLVLGGGGARGCAHISVLRALENLEIPVDFIGGTSIGSCVGGLYSMKGGDLAEVERVFDRFCMDMSSYWKMVKNITFPIVSYVTGDEFNKAIVRIFGETTIENFWTNFYCVATDLGESKEVYLRNGFAWKYIRASMSLTGYLPPICDVGGAEDNDQKVHFLVDGAYTDNLPVSKMRSIVGKSGTVIAVDVQSAWELEGEDYGDSLNGWWYLLKLMTPFVKKPKIPTASEIQSRLAYITCQTSFSITKQESPADIYLIPPLGSVTTMDFHQSKTIQKISYEPLFQILKEWKSTTNKKLG